MVYGIADGACEISFDGVNIEIPEEIQTILEDVQPKIVDGEIEFVYDPDEIDEWAETYNYFG